MRHFLLGFGFAASLLALTPALHAQSSFLAPVAYEDHNQTEPKAIQLNQPHGMVEAADGRPVPHTEIAVFTERKHRLVSTVETDANGVYSFPMLPSGKYRLVALSPGFCSANIPIKITGGLMRLNRSIDLHMEPDATASHPGTCSFASTY
jgi:hypothetical protein